MNRNRILLASAMFGIACGALAQTPIKIGFMAELSGPQGALGQDQYDAFMMVVEPQRRQAGRRAGPDPQGGQPAQAGGRDADRRQADREGQGADHHRRHVLERDDGGAQEDHRQGSVPDRLQRGSGADRRRAVLAVLLHRLVAERQPGRSRRQVRDRQGLQARDRHGAELPGGQGLHRRLQALLQGRDHRRDLHAAQPARLLRRAGAGRRQESRRRLRVLPGRARRQLRPPVQAGGPARQDAAAVDVDRPTARRCRRRRTTRSA